VNFVDTSAWIEFFRSGGNRTVRSNLQSLILTGDVAITEWIILELMAGIRATETTSQVLDRLSNVHRLSFPEDGWARAWGLAARLRKKGVSPSAADCLIATVAIEHDATLIHCDTDFETIAKHEKRLRTLDWTRKQ
jgi:predicted nucleic acid-binding protein